MRGIEERYNRLKETRKKNFNNKLTNELEKFTISKEKHLQDMKQEEELREARVFKKYEGFVSYNSY